MSQYIDFSDPCSFRQMIFTPHTPSTPNSSIKNYRDHKLLIKLVVKKLKLPFNQFHEHLLETFNKEMVSQEIQIGGYPYFAPKGWFRYQLNMSKYLKETRGTDIRMESILKSWAIMYHGIKNENSVAQIINNNFRIGPNQVHQLFQPVITKCTELILQNKKISIQQYLSEKQFIITTVENDHKCYTAKKNTIGLGIYGSPLPTVCAEFCSEFSVQENSKVTYQIMIECRVKSDQVYISSKDLTYWLVRQSKYIVPSALIIRLKNLEPNTINDKNIQKMKTVQQKHIYLKRIYKNTTNQDCKLV